jgi:hypothetical protein
MTPSLNKKEPNCILPSTNNKNLPPKPVQNNPNNNVSYKLPPKPSPLVPSKQNNSVDYSRPSSRDNSSREKGQQIAQRDRSKENLIRAGQQILVDDGLKSPKINNDYQPKNRVVRSSSAQKVVYPSWWID